MGRGGPTSQQHSDEPYGAKVANAVRKHCTGSAQAGQGVAAAAGHTYRVLWCSDMHQPERVLVLKLCAILTCFSTQRHADPLQHPPEARQCRCAPVQGPPTAAGRCSAPQDLCIWRAQLAVQAPGELGWAGQGVLRRLPLLARVTSRASLPCIWGVD